jgi:hypothetical protein
MRIRSYLSTFAILSLALSLALGCNSSRSDGQIAGDIQNKINSDPAVPTKSVSVGVNSGVATLSGNVASEPERTAAANDAAATEGVKTVINNLVVQQADNGVSTPPAAVRSAAPSRPRRVSRPSSQGQSYQAEPAVAMITIPEGTTISVRLIDSLDSQHNKPGDTFRASLDAPIVVDGRVVVPRDADVDGQVVGAKGAGHFAGSSDLSVALTRLVVGSKSYALETDPYTQQGAGRGKRTAEVVGGGAGLGALIGGLTHGGKGAAIGAAIGAGAGTGVQAATHGQQVKLPSETVLQFRLRAPLTLQPVNAERNASRQRIG